MSSFPVQFPGVKQTHTAEAQYQKVPAGLSPPGLGQDPLETEPVCWIPKNQRYGLQRSSSHRELLIVFYPFK